MKITFYKENTQTGFLKIDPNNSVTATTFIHAIEQTTLSSITHNHSFTRSKIEVINDFLRLKELTTLINNSSYDQKIDCDLEKEFSLQKLFELHEHFEELGERYRSNDITLDKDAYNQVINLGCEMNGLIHKLEGSLYGGQWMQALFKNPNIVRIPLTDELIDEAVSSYKKDHLYVGYGETGKNMAHIFEMNEVELLSRQMVQPQRYILSEFFITLDDKPFNYDGYINWCKEHNAQELGYDYTNPIWYGKWEVGKIVEKSYNGITHFPEYDQVKIEL